jgi:anion-transporting  ArsA/GET3 family ATPase
MSLKSKRPIITKMMGKGAKIVWAETDEESEKHFKELKKLRDEYRALGGVFKKKK